MSAERPAASSDGEGMPTERDWLEGTDERIAACTCRPEVVKANAKPSGPDSRYIGHECSCPLHWKAAQ